MYFCVFVWHLYCNLTDDNLLTYIFRLEGVTWTNFGVGQNIQSDKDEHCDIVRIHSALVLPFVDCF